MCVCVCVCVKNCTVNKVCVFAEKLRVIFLKTLADYGNQKFCTTNSEEIKNKSSYNHNVIACYVIKLGDYYI